MPRLRTDPKLETAIGTALVVVVAIALWGKRGPAVGVLAALVFDAIVATHIWWSERTIAWSRRHRVADCCLLAPIAFVALADQTDWSLGLCAAAAVGGVLVLALLVAARSRH